MTEKIAFIGAGNMARSLVGGLLRRGSDPGSIVAADPAADQRANLAALGVATTHDNVLAISGATTVVLAVKPQVLGSVVQGLARALNEGTLLISIAAGVGSTAIARWAGGSAAVVRCMPNTPALYGAGITALFANPRVTRDQAQRAEGILAAVGDVVWVDDEAAIDAVTAVSGSGPAYFFYLMEAMIEAATELGLDPTIARQLTLKTAYGAALMANESGVEPAQLRRNVTSPGGTTERAINVLDAGRCRELIVEALRGAQRRSVELAAEFGNP